MNYLNLKTSRFLFSISFIFSFLSAFAQNHGKIKGTITTSDGDAAAGVNIILKNTKYGTVSTDDGNFDFNKVRANSYTLQVSLTGYETLETEVTVTENETTTVNLQLKVSNKELQEVVISSPKSTISKKQTTLPECHLKI